MIKEMIILSGQSRQTLRNWKTSKPKLYQLVRVGTLTTLNQHIFNQINKDMEITHIDKQKLDILD